MKLYQQYSSEEWSGRTYVWTAEKRQEWNRNERYSKRDQILKSLRPKIANVEK